MAQIDALIAARIKSPTYPTVHGTVVWNGSAWVSPTGGDGSGNHFLADDGTYKTPPGVTELGYAEIGSANVVGTSNATTGNTIATASAITLDGSTTIWIEVCVPEVAGATAGNGYGISVYNSGTHFTEMFAWTQPSGSGSFRIPLGTSRRKLTPSAGTYTFAAKSWSGSGDNVTVYGTSGGASGGTFAPAYIRIMKGA